jgi:hypothetical protein
MPAALWITILPLIFALGLRVGIPLWMSHRNALESRLVRVHVTRVMPPRSGAADVERPAGVRHPSYDCRDW